jgi:hypothetical protein
MADLSMRLLSRELLQPRNGSRVKEKPVYCNRLSPSPHASANSFLLDSPPSALASSAQSRQTPDDIKSGTSEKDEGTPI